MFLEATCFISGHRIAKDRVWHDGHNFRTDCKRCGTAMIRRMNGWQPYMSSSDTDEGCLAPPSERALEEELS